MKYSNRKKKNIESIHSSTIFFIFYFFIPIISIVTVLSIIVYYERKIRNEIDEYKFDLQTKKDENKMEVQKMYNNILNNLYIK